jgi:hypothetical protein
MGLTGKELFPERKMRLGDGNFYTFSFTFRSLSEIEHIFDGDMQKVFGLFEDQTLSSKKLMLMMWSCLLQDQKEFRGLKEEDIKDLMMDLIKPDLILEIKITCSMVFADYWMQVKKSEGNLPPELQAVIDEMNEKGKKKK